MCLEWSAGKTVVLHELHMVEDEIKFCSALPLLVAFLSQCFSQRKRMARWMWHDYAAAMTHCNMCDIATPCALPVSCLALCVTRLPVLLTRLRVTRVTDSSRLLPVSLTHPVCYPFTDSSSCYVTHTTGSSCASLWSECDSSQGQCRYCNDSAVIQSKVGS